MRIGIDVQTLETYERTRGIGRLCSTTVALLSRLNPEHELVLFGFGDEPNEHVARLLCRNVRYASIRLSGSRSEHLRLGCSAPFLWSTPEARELDVYHVTSPMMPDILLPLHAPCPIVATLLDAIPAVMEERGTPIMDESASAAYHTRARVVKRYDRFLAISRSAADDCSRLLDIPSGKIDVTYVPIEQLPCSSRQRGDLELRVREFGIAPGYVLSVTGYNPRKNIAGTLAAYARIRPELRTTHPLVLVCSLQPHENRELQAQARNLGIAGQVILTGYVTDDDLTTLLCGAGVMLFPTLYEGFGLPAADAMAHGVPVVTSDTSSLPEVVGAAGIVCAPDDVDGLGAAVEAFLTDRSLARQHIARGYMQITRFAPVEYTRRVLAAYEAAARCATRSIAVQQERSFCVASFSPLTPADSGISDYTESLLTHMPADVGIDCFVDGYQPTNPAITARFNCYDHGAFPRMHAASPYDAMLYQMGNNLLHASSFPFAERYPGVSVLHEATLLSVYRVLARELGSKHASQLDFAQQYPNADPSAWEHDETLQSIDLFRYPMTRFITERSRAIIVHSEWLKGFIEKANPQSASVHVIPIGIDPSLLSFVQSVNGSSRARYQLQPDDFVICAAGRINRHKRIHVLLEAFARLHAVVPNARLVLVGSGDTAALRQVNRFCFSARLQHAVRLLGHRSMPEMLEVIGLSNVCVNLRYPTLGETSGPLMLMFAMAKPVIVTAIDQFLEFPDDSCWKAEHGSREVAQLTAYLRQLHDSPDDARRLGENGESFVRANAWTNVANKYVEVLKQTAKVAPPIH